MPILLEQGQTTAIYWENGEFHSDPVCTDPVRNFPTGVSSMVLVMIILEQVLDIPPGTKPIHKNNSPGVFSCIRAGANTGATCIRTELKSFKNLAILRKMIPQEYVPVFAQVRIQAPHVFERKLIPPELFPACIGFVPGGAQAVSNGGDLLDPNLHIQGKNMNNVWPKSVDLPFFRATLAIFCQTFVHIFTLQGGGWGRRVMTTRDVPGFHN